MKKSTQDSIIQMLEDALQVAHSAPQRPDFGYPYAAGYCQSVIQNVLDLMRKESDE
jgi:hypothetical protein